jgi:hypothetical protein
MCVTGNTGVDIALGVGLVAVTGGLAAPAVAGGAALGGGAALAVVVQH